jgi:hypothetical protein
MDGGVRGSRSEQRPVVHLELFGFEEVRRAEADGHRELDDHLGSIPPATTRTARQHPGQRVGQPCTVRALAQQHRPGVPDHPLAVGPNGQPTIPPCTLAHQKGALTSVPDSI